MEELLRSPQFQGLVAAIIAWAILALLKWQKCIPEDGADLAKRIGAAALAIVTVLAIALANWLGQHVAPNWATMVWAIITAILAATGIHTLLKQKK